MYARSRTEKIEEFVRDWLELNKNHYKSMDDMLLAIEDINLRNIELEITEKVFFSTWILEKL